MTIQNILVKRLRPTQMTVGKHLVRLKRQGLRQLEKRPQELVNFILSHPIRVVLGPDGHSYIIDHHHLGLALQKEGFKTAPVVVADDLSKLDATDFWQELDRRQWIHPFDAQGARHDKADIPRRLRDLANDPYRSVAGVVRLKGGFRKTDTPYMEFQWADYFRPRIPQRLVRDRFAHAVHEGLALADQPGASTLPGFTGGLEAAGQATASALRRAG